MAFEEFNTGGSATCGTAGPFGRFYLQELINSGGMAEIWLATDQDHKTYALRKLRKNSFFDFTTRKRFLTGCAVLSQIHNHEYVIGYVEHGKIGGHALPVDGICRGREPQTIVARQDPALTENVANILIDMALALEHVHDSGFMHLDFKPENVVVTRNGNVRLVDFDLARPIPKQPVKPDKNPGTPAYMAPEQLQRQPFDQRADIFAYGVTAYELVTGENLFRARRRTRSAPAVEPRRLQTAQPDQSRTPARPVKAIMKCLEREPDKRYPIMNVLVLDLKETLYL